MLFALNNFRFTNIFKKKNENNSSQKKILCVQPRRIACLSLYNRVKQEMGEY